MTIAAWDGQTLAADRLQTDAMDGVIGHRVKVERWSQYLLATAGVVPSELALLQWWKNGAKHEDFPTLCTDKDYHSDLLVIERRQPIRIYNVSPFPSVLVKTRYIAIGSGSREALAAMHCGKSSVEAVKLACKLVTTCGGGPDTVAF